MIMINLHFLEENAELVIFRLEQPAKMIIASGIATTMITRRRNIIDMTQLDVVGGAGMFSPTTEQGGGFCWCRREVLHCCQVLHSPKLIFPTCY